MAKNISNLDKALKQNITPADIGAATSSSVTTVSNNIGTLSNLKTSEKGSLVAAINELFQSANNGKELIASAIGEPLNAEDTFNAMSTDINGLLATFKANMMNNGVTVEAGDKFKSLIDKISTLTDEDVIKNTRVIHGTTIGKKVRLDNGYDDIIVEVHGLPFKPICGYIHNSGLDYGYFIMYEGLKVCSTEKNTDNLIIYEDGFRMPTNTTASGRTYTYWVIGLGEDTTLRDSLADILENKGVDVTEEDDMASLINKVDSISGGLDIISATELPATGKPNQMCIINKNSGSFLVTSNNNDKNPDGFKILLGSANNYPLIPITNNNVIENYRINKVFYGSTQLDSYYWDNNEWTRVSAAKLMAYNKGSFPNKDIIGVLPSNTYVNQTSERIECRTDPRGDWSDGFISFTKPVDFNVYNTITFQAKSSADSHPLDFGLSTEPVNIYSTGTPSGCVKKVSSKSVDTSNSKYTVNISSFSGIGYLTIIVPSVQRFSYYYIYSIELS